MKFKNQPYFFRMLIKALGSGLIVFSFSLTGCQKKDETQAQGGVDGSGGDVSLLSEDTFKSWTETNLKFALRDVVHRLVLIQKNSPQDIDVSDELITQFMGDSPDELQALISSIQFQASSTTCKSANRLEGDAAAYPDLKTICLSYQAFKRFRPVELPGKMIPLALHELSHFRNFNESDAVKLQKLFESDYGIRDKVILQGNTRFLQTREVISNVVLYVNTALQILMKEDAGKFQNKSCQYITSADDRYADFYSSMAFPKHLRTLSVQNIFTPVRELSINCLNLSLEKYSEELVSLLKKSIELSKAIENYESPTCKDDLCPELRSKILYNAEDQILKWELGKKWFLAGKTPPQIDRSKIKCLFEDLLQKKTVEFVGNEENKYTLSLSKYPNPKDLYLWPSNLTANSNPTIGFMGFYGNFQILESHGFTSDHIGLSGWLQEGVQEKASIHFVQIGDRVGSIIFLMDPEFSMVGPTPAVVGEYQLTCELRH